MTDEQAAQAELIASAQLGEVAKDFMASDLGECILGMARQDYQHAIEQLADVEASETAKVINLQIDARVSKRIEQYLSELVQKGEEAIAAWKQQKYKEKE